MATTTSRWAFRKPADTDDVNVALDLNASYDKIDAALGGTPCTSSARPGSPVLGQRIYETDTRRTYVWTGTVWYQIGGPWRVVDLGTFGTANVGTSLLGGCRFRLAATGNPTLLAPTDKIDGDSALWFFTASGGSRTLALTTGSAGSFKFGTDVTALTATPTGTTDVIGATYSAVIDRWLVLAYAKGF